METQNKKQKILLVDDNELTRIYFREVFWLHGLEYKYDLFMAENIETAETLLEKVETRLRKTHKMIKVKVSGGKDPPNRSGFTRDGGN